MTTSEMTDVPKLRSTDSRPSPVHSTSSTSDFWPGVKRRSTYQATPPITPPISSGRTRCQPPALATAAVKPLPLSSTPKARCSTLNKMNIIRSPSSPVATPVMTTMTQNRRVSRASPSPVTFG